MNNQRVIIHADLNSFFATAEQQANPALRGKPVGVVKGRGRTCIIASSVQAKKLGIGTGFRVKDAKKICPDIVLVSADFSKYQDISRRFIQICQSYSPTVEVFSLDECFIDVTETEKFWGNAFNIAFEIKDRICREIGDYMTVSIGVSYNKLLAKLGSGRIKLDGLVWITEDNAIKVLDGCKLMDVCGLGWGLYERLISLGIDNFPKLRASSVEFLHNNFGPFWGPYLWDICRGIDRRLVNSFRSIPDQKSVGRTYTTHRPLNSRTEVYTLARNLAEETTYKARTMGLSGRYVSFCLRTDARQWSGPKEEKGLGKSWYGHRTLATYIDSGKKLFDICKLISSDWDFKNIIFCGVSLGMLTRNTCLTTPLFNDEVKWAKLTKSADAINDKYGEYTVFPAQLLGMPIVMPEVTGYFGDKKFQLRNFLREN